MDTTQTNNSIGNITPIAGNWVKAFISHYQYPSFTPAATRWNWSLNNSALKGGFKYYVRTANDLKKFYIYVNSVTGTPPTYQIGIQADSGGNPSGTFLASGTSTFNATGWWTFTLGGTLAQTADTSYWMIVQYSSGTINTSNFSNFLVYDTPPIYGYLQNYDTTNAFATTAIGWEQTGDGTWGSSITLCNPYVVIEMNDGTQIGNPFAQSTNGTIYGTIENGVGIVSATQEFSIEGIHAYVRSIGLPAGDLLYKIMDSSYATVESGTLAVAANVSTSYGYYTVTFSSPINVRVGDTFYITLKSPSSTDASNGYYLWIANTNTTALINASIDGSSILRIYSTDGLSYLSTTYADVGISGFGTFTKSSKTIANISVVGTTQNNSVKANVSVSDNTQGNWSIADIEPTTVQNNFAIGYIPTTSKSNSVIANIPGTVSSNAIGNIASTTQNNFAKAYIPTTSKINYAVGNIFIPYNMVIGNIDRSADRSNSVIANIKAAYIDKRYEYRVYTQTNTYKTTWATEVLTQPSFRTVINGGSGEIVVRLSRNFDDFGEDDDVKLANRVDLWCFDRESPNGVLLFRGFISAYRPVLQGHQEFVEVTVMNYVAQLNDIMLRDSTGLTTVEYNDADPGNIIKDIIDKYRADEGVINYSATSVDTTGTSVYYSFGGYSVREALDKAIELSPFGWYWYVDSSAVIHFHAKPTSATHTFQIGKEIEYMETNRRVEDVVNRVYFTGGGDPSMFRVYANDGSITSYGIKAFKKVDHRVSLASTADVMSNRILNDKNQPEIRTTIQIADTNGIPDVNQGYDIESIKVGDTFKIRNIKQAAKTYSYWDQAVWDVDVWDQTLATTAADAVQILSIDYNPNYVRLEASSRLPEIAKRMEDIYKNFDAYMMRNNPTSPTAG